MSSFDIDVHELKSKANMKVGRIISELRNAELMVPIWSRVNGKNVVIAIPSRKIVACFSTTLSYNAPLLFLRYHYAREWNNNMEEESSTEYVIISMNTNLSFPTISYTIMIKYYS